MLTFLPFNQYLLPLITIQLIIQNRIYTFISHSNIATGLKAIKTPDLNMTTTVKNNIESIEDYLKDLNDDELVSIHNEYCQSQNSDSEIYNNDEDFFSTFFNDKVLDAVRAVSYGEYNFQHNYVIFNGYGNLESFDNPKENVSIEEIAQDIFDNPGCYYGIELEDCFLVNGTWYEGTEEDAKASYDEYKEEIEGSNEDEAEEDKEEVLTFAEWVIENLSEVD